jgi:hypothetical protein
MSGEVYLAICLTCGAELVAIAVPKAPEDCLSRILPAKKHCPCPNPKCDGRAFIADGTFPGLVAEVDFGPQGNSLKELFSELARFAESNPTETEINEFLVKHDVLKRVRKFFPLDAPSLITYVTLLINIYFSALDPGSSQEKRYGVDVANATECLSIIDAALTEKSLGSDSEEKMGSGSEEKRLHHAIPPRSKSSGFRRSGSFSLKFPKLSRQQRADLLETAMLKLAELNK